MLKYFILILFSLCITLSQLISATSSKTNFSSDTTASIVEINEISAIKNAITPDSLVLLNISGTLYQPAMTLADNQWRTYLSTRAHELIKDKTKADCFINKIKNIIVNNIPKKTVENYTPSLIATLQKEKIPVFGVTQKEKIAPYADNFDFITKSHLENLGIFLEKTFSYTKLNSTEAINHLKYGIVFSDKKPIGPEILNLINSLEKKPSKIILVDNSYACLESTAKALTTSSISFEGYRYSRGDEVKNTFDLTIAHIQFLSLIEQKQLLSNDEAIKIKELNPSINYDLLIDQFILNY